MTLMKLLKFMLRILLIVAVLGGAAYVGKTIIDRAETPQRRRPPAATLTVDAVRLKRQDFGLVLRTRGTVKPRTESALIPEVPGKIVSVSAEFREGGFFEEGEVLLEIDPRDYEAAATVAKSTLARAKLSLEEEKIRILNKKAEVTVAKSMLAKARLAYEQEKIRAQNRESEVTMAVSTLAKAKLALAEQQIADKDKAASVRIAGADVAKAKLLFEEEKARARQALENWKSLGDSDPPGDLVLRKPQLVSAEAAVAAAEAQVERRELDLSLVKPQLEAAQAAVAAAESQLKQRKLDLALVQTEIETSEAAVAAAAAQLEQREHNLSLDGPQVEAAEAAVAAAGAGLTQKELSLERATIRAPYAGRVLSRNVDLGQYVSPGAVIARIYAVDYAEIRLPLTNRQIEFIDLPRLYRGQSVEERLKGPEVVLRANFGRQKCEWRGRIVRAEGAIDVQSRQLFVVAQVDDPYGKTEPGRPPLKSGQFVEAEIQGRTLTDVVVIPRSAVCEGDQVLMINESNQLVRRVVEPVWSDTEQMIVKEGLEPGELLCLTPVTFAGDTLEVIPRIEGEEPKPPSRPGPPSPGDGGGPGGPAPNASEAVEGPPAAKGNDNR